MSNDIKLVRQALKRLVDVIAAEADRNPAFAESVRLALFKDNSSKKDSPPKVASKQPAPSVADPFVVLNDKGLEGLRVWLSTLGILELRSIVREHRLDPSRLSDKWKTVDRFVDLIADRVAALSRKGESFRHYSQRQGETQGEEEPTTETEVASSMNASEPAPDPK